MMLVSVQEFRTFSHDRQPHMNQKMQVGRQTRKLCYRKDDRTMCPVYQRLSSLHRVGLDRQTDRWTDTKRSQYCAMHYNASRGKKTEKR